jgi:hypothetical protein
MERSPRCSRHPEDAAAWRCRACGTALCPACTDTSGGRVRCAECGEVAGLLTSPGSEATLDPAEAIAVDVRRGDLRAAAARFAALPATPTTLPARLLLQVAKGAGGEGAPAVAARALRSAARSRDPAIAAEALLGLARLCLDGLRRPAEARAAIDELLARFPESPAATQARALHPPPAG